MQSFSDTPGQVVPRQPEPGNARHKRPQMPDFLRVTEVILGNRRWIAADVHERRIPRDRQQVAGARQGGREQVFVASRDRLGVVGAADEHPHEAVSRGRVVREYAVGPQHAHQRKRGFVMRYQKAVTIQRMAHV